jgi:hypothetical protein
MLQVFTKLGQASIRPQVLIDLLNSGVENVREQALGSFRPNYASSLNL